MTTKYDDFIEFLLEEASKKREDAGYAGSHGDGGASKLEDQVAVFISGLANTVPTVWSDYQQEFNNVNDPEYEKYLELKEKFGD